VGEILRLEIMWLWSWKWAGPPAPSGRFEGRTEAVTDIVNSAIE